jgi:hypothetical protein
MPCIYWIFLMDLHKLTTLVGVLVSIHLFDIPSLPPQAPRDFVPIAPTTTRKLFPVFEDSLVPPTLRLRDSHTTPGRCL